MADKFTKEKRSLIMSHVSGKETKLEVKVRKLLFSERFRFRKNVKNLPGRPDIVLPKYKVAIFVHGCFWHGHKGCPRAKLPETNRGFWERKIAENIERDQKNIKELRDKGWRVIIIWQDEISSKAKMEKKIKKITQEILNVG